jgi:hypothetical protein
VPVVFVVLVLVEAVEVVEPAALVLGYVEAVDLVVLPHEVMAAMSPCVVGVPVRERRPGRCSADARMPFLALSPLKALVNFANYTVLELLLALLAAR